MKKIKLTNGKFVKVDDEYYEYLSQFKWGSNGVYARGYVNGEKMYMHQLIMGRKQNKEIDHIDRNTLNNQKKNLRFCTRSENQKNKKASGKSKYLGVIIHTSKKKYFRKKDKTEVEYLSKSIIAHIKTNGKYLHLGTFKNEIDAAKAYNNAAIKYHGEFARLNKV